MVTNGRLENSAKL